MATSGKPRPSRHFFYAVIGERGESMKRMFGFVVASLLTAVVANFILARTPLAGYVGLNRQAGLL